MNQLQMDPKMDWGTPIPLKIRGRVSLNVDGREVTVPEGTSIMRAAAEAGIQAVIQPGGSMRDDDVIAAADAAGLAMIFTGMRHFRH